MKTISVAELGHGHASRAVRAAQDEPVLVSKENRPAAWIISAQELAKVAAARGEGPEIYQRTLELIAVDLYRREVLTLGQAAKLAAISMGDFIDLCSALQVPILWESEEGIAAEVDAFASILDDSGVATAS